MGNAPVTDLTCDEEDNEHEINNGNKTVNIPPLPNNAVEFDIPMYKCQSQVLMRKIITLLKVKKCNLIQISLIVIYQLPQWLTIQVM